MFKIPKQEYTAEFKDLAVKRVKGGQSVGAVAKELGLVEQTLRNWVKAAKAGKLHAPGLIHHSDRGSQYASHAAQLGESSQGGEAACAGGEGGHAGTDGAVTGACRECPFADGK